ncbi:reverse transcriptase domain-containing protein [Tanacetum coccineum]
MKKLIAVTPNAGCTPTKVKEELIYITLAADQGSFKPLVLRTKGEASQLPVYFESRAISSGWRSNYTSTGKHLSIQPCLIAQAEGLKKDLIIQYRDKESIKGQILADFIVERPDEESPDEPMAEPKELPEPWTLFTDGSSYIDGSRARYSTSNQVPPGARTKKAVALRARNKFASKSFAHTLSIFRDKKKASGEDVAKASRYTIINGTLYKKSFLGPWLCKACCDYHWQSSKEVRIGTHFCRFGLPGEIVSDNRKQFRDNPFKDWCEKLCIRQCFATVKLLTIANVWSKEHYRSLRGEDIKARLDERIKDWIGELSQSMGTRT